MNTGTFDVIYHGYKMLIQQKFVHVSHHLLHTVIYMLIIQIQINIKIKQLMF